MEEKLVTIAVTTYNRKNTLMRMAESLYRSDLGMRHEIRVYDDASDEYSEEELRALFPTACAIVREKENMGTDEHMDYVYHDFIRNGGDYFFHADSDLLFHKDWLKVALEKIRLTDGILSLFNTSIHKGRCLDNGLVEKEDIGCAGTILSREKMSMICENKEFDLKRGIDWEWCRMFREKGIHIFTTQKSYVQHIGFWGIHCREGLFDYGEGFEIDHENGKLLNDAIAEYAFIRNRDYIPNDLSIYKASFLLGEVLKRIKKRFGKR